MINNDYYRMACEYMAKTELYDRLLTSCRSPWDNTEAFIHQPYIKRLSYSYAAQLRKYYKELCGDTWQPIHEEIHKHTHYTAQMWVDEYYRLQGEENDDKNGKRTIKTDY